MPNSIFELITQQETAYTLPITVVDGWEWSMKEHIRLATLYKNSQFATGNTEKERDMRPFVNIVRPLLDLQYRAEGFDVKDILLYIDDQDDYFKSFLVKKYHDRWARDNDIDTFIDEMVESYVDFGGTLVREPDSVKPIVMPLGSIGFCDQTNMLSGPIGFVHFYSPDELQGFEKAGWGDPKNGATITIEELIVMMDSYKVPDSQTGIQNKTPGKYGKVYEVHGVMPESWLPGYQNSGKYARQMQIVAFYKDKDGKEHGVTLFCGREKENLFRVLKREGIHGRALGFGGVEELLDPQVFRNLNAAQAQDILANVSKIIWKTTDPAFKNRNTTNDMDSGEILVIEDGKDFAQLQVSGVNIGLFENAAAQWEATAKEIASATGATTGISPGAKVSFNALALLTQQGLALHTYRQGKIATFLGNLYREWILPKLVRDLIKGKKFLAELSLDELQTVADQMVTCQTNDIIKDKILNGVDIIPSDIEALKTSLRTQFTKKGAKHFMEIFKDEMKDAAVEVDVSIVGKQKDVAGMTTKFIGMVSQIFANPALLNDPRMAGFFNQAVEALGFSPINFTAPEGAKPAQNAAPTPPVLNGTPSPIDQNKLQPGPGPSRVIPKIPFAAVQ